MNGNFYFTQLRKITCSNYMRPGIPLIFFIFVSFGLYGQQSLRIKGRIADSTGAVLPSASIKLNFGKDSLFGQSDKDGAFVFSVARPSAFQLFVSMVGFLDYEKKFVSKPGDSVMNVGNILLAADTSELDNVVVVAKTPVKVMEDTVQYSVSAFKVRDGAPAEDVIKKLPGVVVDKDGNITSQGKAISRIRVNGKDFFGGDVQTATQNLPADILDNIQIIEDYGDQANLTGIKTGEPETIININVKPNKKRGYFGSANASAGTNGRYVAGVMANTFQEERQISLLGSMNNTNTNTFNFNGGGRGGGARGNNMGGGERGGAGGNGFTRAASAGLNYRDKWGEKISVYGSYSFSNRINETESATQSQDINPANIRFTNSLRSSNSNSTNHRITFNLEYTIDTANYIKITPYLSLSQSRNAGSNITEIHRSQYFSLNNGNNASKSSAPNAGGSFLYNHKFKKRGRNFNLTTTLGYSDRDQENLNRTNYRNIDSLYVPLLIEDTLQQQVTDVVSTNMTSNVRVSYTEPLGNSKTKFLELSYDYNRSATNNNREVYDLQASNDPKLNEPQSNHYEYQFITHRLGLNLKGNHIKYNYVVGVVSQPSVLNGQSVGKDINTHYTNMNWIPSARFVYNLGKSHTLTANYDGRSREPNFMQLQPVADSSNLNNIVIGNPGLQAEFTNNLSIRYNKFNRQSGRTIFGNITYDRISNKIVTSRYNNPTGTGRTTTYINTDGFYSISGNGSYTQPFINKKLSATVRLDASYNNNISYTDNQRNKGRNLNIRPGAVIRLDIVDIVDLNLNAGYTFYKTTTQYVSSTNTSKAQTLQFGLGGKNYFFKDLTVGYDVAKTINYGFSNAASVNPLILNLYTEYRFLKGKKATIRFQGFDLLNENTGISRTINETTITDRRDNRLARYFLLSFNFRLQKFGGGVKAPERTLRKQKGEGDF
jgi:hypothetical protein